MQVRIVLDPVRDPLLCASKSVKDGQPCLAPARWRALLRRGVAEARWTACDAHLFPCAQWFLHGLLATESLSNLVVVPGVGQPQ